MNGLNGFLEKDLRPSRLKRTRSGRFLMDGSRFKRTDSGRILVYPSKTDSHFGIESEYVIQAETNGLIKYTNRLQLHFASAVDGSW